MSFILDGLGVRKLTAFFHFWVNYYKSEWHYLDWDYEAVVQIAAVQQRALEDRRTGQTDTEGGVCRLRGVGEIPLFSQRMELTVCKRDRQWTKISCAALRPRVPCWNSPLQPSWSSGSSSHWHCSGWRSKMVSRSFFYFFLPCYHYFKTWRKSKMVFLLLENKINWMCMCASGDNGNQIPE